MGSGPWSGQVAVGLVVLGALLGCSKAKQCSEPPGGSLPSSSFQQGAPWPSSSSPASAAVGSSSAGQLAPAWESLEDGLSVREWQAGGNGHVVRVDPKRWELQSVPSPSHPDGSMGLQLGQAIGQAVGAKVVVNGGFFGERGEVLGLRTSRGQPWSPLRKADWGVFFVKEHHPGLLHTKEADQTGNVEFAIQCGPRLIAEGSAMHLRPGIARRTVIGADRTGAILLVATKDPVGLNELTTVLLKEEVEGGLGLVDALNLDGGPSTQMYIDAGTRRWDILGSPVADAVAVVSRGHK